MRALSHRSFVAAVAAFALVGAMALPMVLAQEPAVPKLGPLDTVLAASEAQDGPVVVPEAVKGTTKVELEDAPKSDDAPPSNVITAGTYAFSFSSSNALEDMSSGTTAMLAADLDDTAGVVTPIGFDFWFDGVRQTQFSINANGLIRLGVAVVGTTFSNVLTSTTNQPQICPYWDDLWVGNNDGKVHYKVVGTAPNRKLVIEWKNMQIPRVAAATAGAGTFQAWLYETTGVIEFVYGPGIAANATNSGASIGLATAAASFASVTASSNTVSYAVANDTNTAAIPAGTKYTFTPNVPAAPTGLNFTATGLNTMTLNWTDNASTEVGYAIYRSVDGVSYDFIAQTAANATSFVASGLASNTTWFWRVVAVSEGAQSTALSGSNPTTTGTVVGTKSVGPTGFYTSLGAAMTDINTNGLAGGVTLELQAAYLSSVETFPLVIAALGSPSNPITIRPEAGATALSITSAAATATVDLNGPTNVTIDGRAGGAGPSQLTIANTAVGSATVRLINGASRNTLTFTTVRGVNTSTTGGVVLFSTSTGATGNNNNTIDTCDITDGATTPVNGITSIGTATTAQINTGNTVNNCNISNFFSATAATNGILVTINTNLSNHGWTITNNRFFQSATRTYTTANTHRAIQILGGSGYNVSGNTVGFATAAGTGTYTMTGAVATGFVAIQLQPGDGLNNIQGNTVTAISLGTTTGALTGISVTSGAVNVGTITGNTVGAPTGNGAITVLATGTGSAIIGMNASGTAAGTINLSNNSIGSLTDTASPATNNANINGMQATGGAVSVTNNTIGSASTANSVQVTATGTAATGQQVIGLITGLSPPTLISGNTVANLTNNGTGTVHVTRGIQLQNNAVTTGAGAGSGTISNNTIHDLSGASANTTIAGGGTGIQGILYTGTSPFGASVTGNTIYTISATNAGAVAVTSLGIGYSNPTGGSVTKNRIYDIRNASTMTTATTPPNAVGIMTRAAPDVMDVVNNMISLGDSQSTNTEFIGIWNSLSTVATNRWYYNSVHITGTAAAGALPSYAALRGDNTAASAVITPTDVRNNILNNTRTGGTGKHYAIGNVNSAPATGWPATASNNNVLNSAVASTVGNWGLALDRTFAQWQGSSGGDGASLSGVSVIFTNAATADLHLNFGVTPTAIESGGTTIAAYTTDYDNQTRPGPPGSVNGGAIAPDIGADEFDGVPLDITGPSISYTPIPNTIQTTDRLLAATITDTGSGVAGGALSPRIYYRKNAGPYFSSQCSSGGGNLWNCTIVVADMGGVATGDVVSYFVIAQDTVGNVSSNPAGAVATDVNNVSSPPATPNTYTIVPTIFGTKTVCASGCNYATLTGAGGAFADINSKVATGNIELQIAGDLTVGEDGSNALNPLSEDPVGSNYTVKIYPTGVPLEPDAVRLVTGSSATALIRLNAADRITIDGSANGAGSTRDMTITNTNAGTASAVVYLNSNGTDGATNNTIKNLNVVGSNTFGAAVNGTLFGIGSSGPTIGIATFGTGNNTNNTIQNNNVSKSQYGIFSAGVSAASKNSGTVITQNQINTASPNGIVTGGILVFFDNGVQVTQNSVGNIVRHNGTTGLIQTAFGIAIGAVPNNSVTTFTGSEVTNAVVTRNNVDGVLQLNATGYSAFGIVINAATSGTSLAANNMVARVRSAATANDFTGGIVIGGGLGSTTQVYNNSVNMTGSRNAATFPSYALAIAAGDPIVDARDNILVNTQTSTSTGKSYAIATGATTFANLTSNNNDLFVAGTATFVGQTGGLGTAGTDRATLANWQAITGKDGASISADPLFITSDPILANDLHINQCLSSPVNNAGVSIGAVTVDFDNQPRGATPDIGADEFTPAIVPCNDSNDCTGPDTCNPASGCQFPPVANGTFCGDAGTQCTNQDLCQGGVCQDNGFQPNGTACGSPADTNCDNPDTCNGLGTCQPNYEPNGFPCPDGLGCTTGDTCNGSGTCVLIPVNCNDGSACTSDACVEPSGSCSYALSGACNINGTLRYYRNNVGPVEPSTKPIPIQNVTRTSTFEATSVATTDASGNYSFTNEGGNVTLTPAQVRLMTDEDECHNSITAADAAQIAQASIGVVTLTANQTVAADVSNNGTISSFDAALTAQKAVANPCLNYLFPVRTATGSDWAFRPVSRSYSPLTGVGEDYSFLGVLYGDVTGNWTAPVLFSSEADTAKKPAIETTIEATMADSSPRIPTVDLMPMGEVRAEAKNKGAVLYVAGAPTKNANGTWSVVLGLQRADGILGLDMNLRFDSRSIQVVGVTTTGIGSVWSASGNVNGDSYRVALFGVEALQGTGAFLKVTYLMTSNVNGLPFGVAAQANEGQIPISWSGVPHDTEGPSIHVDE